MARESVVVDYATCKVDQGRCGELTHLELLLVAGEGKS